MITHGILTSIISNPPSISRVTPNLSSLMSTFDANVAYNEHTVLTSNTNKAPVEFCLCLVPQEKNGVFQIPCTQRQNPRFNWHPHNSITTVSNFRRRTEKIQYATFSSTSALLTKTLTWKQIGT